MLCLLGWLVMFSPYCDYLGMDAGIKYSLHPTISTNRMRHQQRLNKPWVTLDQQGNSASFHIQNSCLQLLMTTQRIYKSHKLNKNMSNTNKKKLWINKRFLKNGKESTTIIILSPQWRFSIFLNRLSSSQIWESHSCIMCVCLSVCWEGGGGGLLIFRRQETLFSHFHCNET